jgi:hypothetical protein
MQKNHQDKKQTTKTPTIHHRKSNNICSSTLPLCFNGNWWNMSFHILPIKDVQWISTDTFGHLHLHVNYKFISPVFILLNMVGLPMTRWVNQYWKNLQWLTETKCPLIWTWSLEEKRKSLIRVSKSSYSSCIDNSFETFYF